MAIDSGQATGSFANRTADIKELILTGPDVKASAAGTLALGATGESKLAYDVAVTNLEPLAKRFDQPFAGSAHVVGEASGPAANLTLSGKFGANRLRYGTTVDALTANSTYTAQLPNFDIQQARIQADTTATFVTIAGRNLPRVTAKTVYEKNELQFDTMVEEERRSLGLGGNVLFHPDHDELHLRALNLTVGKTQWALPQGQEAVAQYSKDSVTLENFVLERGTQRVTAAGTVAIGASSATLANNLNVRLDNVQVQDINELLLGNRSLEGVLNASAEIRGTRNEPVVQSDFAVTAGTVEGVKFNSLAGSAKYCGPRSRRGRSSRADTCRGVDGRRHDSRAEWSRLDRANRRVRSRSEEHAHRHRAAAAGDHAGDEACGAVHRRRAPQGNAGGASIERPRRNDQRRLQRCGDGSHLHQRDRAPAVRGRSGARGSLRVERRRYWIASS